LNTKLLIHPRVLLTLYIALAIFTGLQQYIKTQQVDERYSRYNNYIIFKESHVHLIDGKDLYCEYADEHWDLFKYTPTFAMFFGVLSYLPDVAGLIIWNLINVLFLFFSIRLLPDLNDRSRAFILLYIIIELATSLQNLQSNALITGLIIMGFALLEKRRYRLATLLIISTAFIKVFGLLAIILYLFYPKKARLIAYSISWGLLLLILPAIFTGFSGLLQQYKEWIGLLLVDQDYYTGYSIFVWLSSWFGLEAPRMIILFIGFFLCTAPMLRYKAYQNYRFRLMALASVLLWIVIFNHMAESPTFIIAVTGVAIWFVSRRVDAIGMILIILVFLFTCLSLTDLVPRDIQKSIVIPYVLKVVPCIFVWLLLVLEMGFDKTVTTGH